MKSSRMKHFLHTILSISLGIDISNVGKSPKKKQTVMITYKIFACLLLDSCLLVVVLYKVVLYIFNLVRLE